MPLPDPLLLRHALILYIPVFRQQLIKRQTPLLLLPSSSYIAYIPPALDSRLLTLQWVDPEVLLREEGGARVQELMLRVVVVDQ